MLARLKITTRINLTLLLAVLGIVMVAVIGFSIMRAQMMDERRGQLRNLLDLTLSIARADMMAAGGPTSEAGKKAFFSVLRSTRFGDEKQANYIFAFDYDGVATAMNDPSKLGNNLTGIADANGVKFVKEFINIARGPSGTGFIEYLYQKGVGGPITSKISLVQNIPEIGGLAGVGVYLDDLDQTFFHRLFMELWHSKKVLLIGLFITAGLIVLLSYSLIYAIGTGLAAANSAVDAVAVGEFSKEIDLTRRDEIGDLFETLDRMTANLRATADVADTIASGDLSVDPKPLSDKDALGPGRQAAGEHRVFPHRRRGASTGEPPAPSPAKGERPTPTNQPDYKGRHGNGFALKRVSVPLSTRRSIALL